MEKMKKFDAANSAAPHPMITTRFGRVGGFTLIELMIVVAIIGILAAIAYPSYTQYIIRGNRAAAQAQMMDIASREQQIFLANRGYAAKGDTAWTSTGYTLPAEVSSKYTYGITADNTTTPPIFTITFTATGSQASDGNLTLDQAGNKTPAAKW